jgi:cysteine synthase A
MSIGTDTGAAVVHSFEELVGGTPLLEFRLPGTPAGVRTLAKLEMFNPLASIKDRAVLHMFRAAQASGALPPSGGTVIECSSGSTGISLAAFCRVHGHRCIIVLPDNATPERRLILRELGAEIVTVPAGDGLLAAWARAEQMQRDLPGSWVPHQDTNPANVQAHYETTAPELWQATGGEIDVLVCGVGTGGTLTGVARFLKERRDVHVVAVEPARSAVLSGGEAGPHGIPGIGAGYVSSITDLTLIDEVIAIEDDDAAATSHDITAATGLLVGISSGAAAHAVRLLAARLARGGFAGSGLAGSGLAGGGLAGGGFAAGGSGQRPGITIVTVFPDNGERYLSTKTP